MLERTAGHARELLAGRVVWNLNSTAQGGGVAEMLQVLLAYGRGAGVDTRWLVLEGDPDFFLITKRLHNMLHGSPGDGGGLGPAQRAHFLEVSQANASVATSMVRPGDVVLLHDPQTAGLVAPLKERGASVTWRCHVGSGMVTEETEAAWEFLRPLIEPADAWVFSRPSYVPEWLPPDRARIIAPSIDPFSTKNVLLEPPEVGAALGQAGLVDLPVTKGSRAFGRRRGDTGSVRPHRDLLLGEPPLPGGARVVMQLSRWDRLKDMSGVLSAFADHLDDLPDDVHLLLAGPEVLGVVDDNAHLVNALQHHAAVVVQKSLAEGFGLTVTEPMWKARPVVASAVGGIPDQIEDGVSGVLLADPRDGAALVAALAALLDDADRRRAMGRAAHLRVRDHYLADRHLIQYAELFAQLAGEG